jgi:hypothetical protein
VSSVRRSGRYLAWVMPMLLPILLSAQFWQVPSASARPIHPVAARPGGAAWQEVWNRHYGALSNASGFSAVVVTGRDDAWAFGGTNPGGPSVPVAVHLARRQWHPALLPAGLTGFISSASATSARDIWAVSSSGGYALHWNGTTWTVAKRWHNRGEMTDVTALSSDNVWVFGTGAAGLPGVGSWHLSHHIWSRVSGLGGKVYRASADSKKDIWGIVASRTGGRIVRYNGRRWRLVHRSAALRGIHMSDILTTSARDAWVAGNLAAKHGYGRLVLAHWNGRNWVRIVLAADGWAGKLAPDGHGGVWLTAEATSLPAHGLVLHVSAAGLRSRSNVLAGMGSGVSGLALLRGPNAIVATGGYLTPAGGNAAIWWRQPLADREIRDADHDSGSVRHL